MTPGWDRWMQVIPRDWVEVCPRLSTQEFGGYVLLAFRNFSEGQGLSCDMKFLTWTTKLSRQKTKALVEKLKELELAYEKDGKLHIILAQKEVDRVAESYETKRENGKKGGLSKKN